MTTPVLESLEVTVSFGGLRALEQVSISVAPASIHGLIGPNGAGKSTLFNVFSGLLRPRGGDVFVDGRNVTRLRPQRRFALGLTRTFQRPQLFRTLTVREHLLVARRSRRRSRVSEAADVQAIIDLLDLGLVADVAAALVPLGTARLVEIGRAIAGEPRVVLLDEPSSGLDTAETATVAVALRRVRDERGAALVLVEHDVDLVMDLSDHVDVLDFGRVLASGAPADVRDAPAVTAAYLGLPA